MHRQVIVVGLVLASLVLHASAQGGACCMPNTDCIDVPSASDCSYTYLDGVACAVGLCIYEVTPYVDPLPILETILPVNETETGMPYYDVQITQFTQVLHSEFPSPTTVWGYNDHAPGPTFDVKADEAVMVKFTNALANLDGTPMRHHYFPVPNCTHGADFWSDSPRVVTHLHGAHALAAMDGHPDYSLLAGQEATYVYSNKQLPTTLWYHDHALGITRLNIYMGLAGAYVIRGEEEASLNLPSGEFDVPLVMQDRSFNSDGSLAYPPEWVSIFNGNMMVVNGVVWPYMDVCRGKYLFRLVNGGNGLHYTLELDSGAEFVLVGTDGGLIAAPLSLGNSLGLAAAERMSVVIDFENFAPGTEIIMSQKESVGNGQDSPNLLKFIVGDCTGHTDPLPTTLLPFEPIAENEASQTNEVLLYTYPGFSTCGDPETWLMDGLGWDDITVFIPLNDTQIFIFANPYYVMHPMHIHLTQFQVLGRQRIQPVGSDGNYTTAGPWTPPADYEVGWKDVVNVERYERVKVIGRFTDYAGRFPYHCHIATHEDHEMMRQFRVTMLECDNDGTCDFGEDCYSCPGDCMSLGGEKCGNQLCETGDGENCTTCPEDCPGVQGENEGNYCCGGDNNPGENPVYCGDARCLDSSKNIFCKVAPNLPACCGDEVCEGQETMANCPVDCKSDQPMYHATVG